MQLLQLIISGAAPGCIYGLIALGFVLIYKATETVSFAQGDLMMLGAFAGLVLMTLAGFPFWLAVLGAVGAMALFGVLVERIVIREREPVWYERPRYVERDNWYLPLTFSLGWWGGHWGRRHHRGWGWGVGWHDRWGG